MSGYIQGCSPTGNTIIVADTGAFITGAIRGVYFQVYTTNTVIGEIRDPESRRTLEELKASGRLTILDPPRSFIDNAFKKASKGMSRTDIEVLALALYLKSLGCRVVVATDDYALQETVRRSGLMVMRIRYRGARRA